MKNKTAVEWLIEQWPILEAQIPERILEQANAIFEQQIIDAYLAGMDTPHLEIRSDEEYFNDTYKGGKK
jgi:hypothetical protein